MSREKFREISIIDKKQHYICQGVKKSG